MNDLKKSGDELIAIQRERDVLENGHTIFADACMYKNGELAQLAVALINNTPSETPDGINPSEVLELFALGSIERLIKAGALISAQIDVFNFMEMYNESLKTLPDGENEKDGAKLIIEAP